MTRAPRPEDGCVRYATIDDIARVCRAMRWADRVELRALGDSVAGFRRRIEAMPAESVFYGERGGEPIGLAGCSWAQQGLTRVGIPWGVFTDAVSQHALWTARWARHLLETWGADGSLIGNYVHEPHVNAQRWLLLVGCELGAAQEYGPRSERFRPFVWSLPRRVADV